MAYLSSEMRKIPIKNIYYLLCYSWNRLEESEIVDVSDLDFSDHVDLYAFVLIKGIRHLLRRGLAKGYQEHSEVIPGIRGRVNIAPTMQKMLIPQGLAHCSFDELTINILANQIIKSTIHNLTQVQNIDGGLKQQLRVLAREMSGIDLPLLNKALFRRIQLNSNARYYRFLLNICELIFNSIYIDESTGQYRFKDFTQDELKMAQVFEEFLFKFYQTERPDLIIKKEKINWHASVQNPGDLKYLPQMKTDISISSSEKKVIIDAKYYRKSLSNYYDTEKVHSGHLYQLLAYLKNIEAQENNVQICEGMLIYPTVKETLRLEYSLLGHRVQICTVNLADHWTDIRDELLGLIQDIKTLK